MRPISRRLSTEELHPDLTTRRSLRTLLGKHRNNFELLNQIKEQLSLRFRRRHTAEEAIEAFSHEERSITELNRIYGLFCQLSGDRLKNP